MKVLVYGTLKRGFGNNYLLESSKFLGTFVTPPQYTMLHLGGFPGVVLEGKTPVHGEVFEITPETFQRLDRLEGYPYFYNRVEVQTDFGPAWMYHLNDKDRYHGHKTVQSGVWK